MGQRHKGSRVLVIAPVVAGVRDGIDKLSAETGVERSTLLADAAAGLVGRADLIESVRFDINPPAEWPLGGDEGPRALPGCLTIASRLPAPVCVGLEQIVAQIGARRTTLLGDLAAAVIGRPDLARRPHIARLILGEAPASPVFDDGRLQLAM
ncbi:hypothetical protein [Mycobacterium sp. shizuoka-1]|uniref:hypothetical protein n=1 Tax=Mycobacterium sp. shizuoka-1 TaxID=2039281 RepID=UPI000C06559D|nr:hypothetical protein [Mycobacterium sp. shizuoka-1]GAY19327.1 hypothetical protein MSZK_60530 [Mycobacterium sp. shizuoka-1]